MNWLALWICLLVVLPIGQLGAQQQLPSLQGWDVCEVATCHFQPDSGARLSSARMARRDYRYEGLIVGGIMLGALGAWIGNQIVDPCSTDPAANCAPRSRLGDPILGGLVGVAIGGGLGYLVGQLFSKPQRPASDTIR